MPAEQNSWRFARYKLESRFTAKFFCPEIQMVKLCHSVNIRLSGIQKLLQQVSWAQAGTLLEYIRRFQISEAMISESISETDTRPAQQPLLYSVFECLQAARRAECLGSKSFVESFPDDCNAAIMGLLLLQHLRSAYFLASAAETAGICPDKCMPASLLEARAALSGDLPLDDNITTTVIRHSSCRFHGIAYFSEFLPTCIKRRKVVPPWVLPLIADLEQRCYNWDVRFRLLNLTALVAWTQNDLAAARCALNRALGILGDAPDIERHFHAATIWNNEARLFEAGNDPGNAYHSTRQAFTSLKMCDWVEHSVIEYIASKLLSRARNAGMAVQAVEFSDADVAICEVRSQSFQCPDDALIYVNFLMEYELAAVACGRARPHWVIDATRSILDKYSLHPPKL